MRAFRRSTHSDSTQLLAHSKFVLRSVHGQGTEQRPRPPAVDPEGAPRARGRRDRPEPQRRRGGHPRRALRRPLPADAPAGRCPERHRRRAPADAAGAEGQAQPPRLRAPAVDQRPDRRDALGAARRPRPKGHPMACTNGSSNGRRERRQGSRRDHRRRQLRQLAAAGRRVLQGRAGRRVRPRPDARQPRRLPRPRHRVHRRVRRGQGQGRQGPLRGDLGAPERHDQVRRRPEDRRQGLARHDPRRDRQVPLRGRREGARRRPTTWSGSSRRPAPTSSSTTSRSAPRRRRSGTRSRSSRPAARW